MEIDLIGKESVLLKRSGVGSRNDKDFAVCLNTVGPLDLILGGGGWGAVSTIPPFFTPPCKASKRSKMWTRNIFAVLRLVLERFSPRPPLVQLKPSCSTTEM